MPPTCGLSARRCAFGAASPARSPSNSFSSPVVPAAASACPRLAFTPPTASGTRRVLSTDAASELASIGSPSDVPVPCASFSASVSVFMLVSLIAASSKLCCAWPLGAVRLADRPSCRTALPFTSARARLLGSLCPRSVIVQHASPRAYPSARASNVCERPSGDVMPAIAKVTPKFGTSSRLRPAASESVASFRTNAQRDA